MAGRGQCCPQCEHGGVPSLSQAGAAVEGCGAGRAPADTPSFLEKRLPEGGAAGERRHSQRVGCGLPALSDGQTYPFKGQSLGKSLSSWGFYVSVRPVPQAFQDAAGSCVCEPRPGSGRRGRGGRCRRGPGPEASAGGGACAASVLQPLGVAVAKLLGPLWTGGRERSRPGPRDLPPAIWEPRPAERGRGAGKGSRPGARGSGSGHAPGGQLESLVCSAASWLQGGFQQMAEEVPAARVQPGTLASEPGRCVRARGQPPVAVGPDPPLPARAGCH